MAKGKFKKDALEQADKIAFGLLDPKLLEETAKVLTAGSKKYGRNNFENCPPDQQYAIWDALYRHLNAYQQGIPNDKDTGLSHLAHATCNIMFLFVLANKDRNDLDEALTEYVGNTELPKEIKDLVKQMVECYGK